MRSALLEGVVVSKSTWVCVFFLVPKWSLCPSVDLPGSRPERPAPRAHVTEFGSRGLPHRRSPCFESEKFKCPHQSARQGFNHQVASCCLNRYVCCFLCSNNPRNQLLFGGCGQFPSDNSAGVKKAGVVEQTTNQDNQCEAQSNPPIQSINPDHHLDVQTTGVITQVKTGATQVSWLTTMVITYVPDVG